jgi:RNA polymerase sigma-70 factor (ECF subfamily)
LETAREQTDWSDIRASLEGDESAYARLVERYQDRIFSQMWRFTRDPSVQEELVQEVFIDVYRSLKTFRGKAPFLHWIRRIATRVGYRYWKQEARRRRVEDAVESRLVDAAPSPEEESPSEAAERLHEILGRLRPKERLLLTLIYFEECDTREIAERTGWNVNLVRVGAHRARQKLKKLLEEEGFRR